MKHTLLFFLALLTFTASVQAQLVLDNASVTATSLSSDASEELEINVTNTSNDEVTVRWTRSEDLPSGWFTYVCDIVNCYTPAKDSSEFVLAAGASGFIKLTVTTASFGTGVTDITLFDVMDPDNSVTATFTATTNSTTDLTAIDVSAIQVYPNPTTNFFMIKHAKAIARVEIINLVGRTVRTFEYVSASDKLNVSDLPRGMYLVRMTNKNGQVMTTQRLSKR